jgi:hypothetical protein
MCEWIHICTDIGSEQDMDKTTRAFGDLLRRIICYMWMGRHVVTLVVEKTWRKPL